MSAVNRPWHKLRPVKTTRTPRRVVFLDVESWDRAVDRKSGIRARSLRLWVASCIWFTNGRPSVKAERAGRSVHEFWSWLDAVTSDGKSTWVFSHNLSHDATLLHLWDVCLRGMGEVRSYVIDDPPAIIRTRFAGKSVVWVDVLNYWRAPLQQIGEAVGIERYPEPTYPSTDSQWEDFCRRDVLIIEQAVCQLLSYWTTEQLGPWAPTAAGLAWSAFRSHWLTSRIDVHNDTDALQVERAAFHGGRCSAFYLGRVNSPVHHLDVNSLYPWAMAYTDQPVKLLRGRTAPPKDEVKSWLDDFLVAAWVTLESGSDDYPRRKGGKLEFVCGRFGAYLIGPELARAFRSGHVREVHRAFCYHRGRPFTSYVEHFLREKAYAALNQDFPRYELCKLLLNGLYGKFGQRSNEWAEDRDVIAPSPYGQFWQKTAGVPGAVYCRAVAGCVQRQEVRGEWRDSCPAIAGNVTAIARERMRELIARTWPARVYYMDTDSLHCSGRAAEKLEAAGMCDSTECGLLKTVEVGSSAEYRGVKDYTIGHRTCRAGIKGSALCVADGTYLQDCNEGLPTILKNEPGGDVFYSMREVRFSGGNGKPVGRDLYQVPIQCVSE